MKRRINFMCIILTVITILETVALSATVFYGILTKEVIEDLKNSADVMIESDAWNIVSGTASPCGRSGFGENYADRGSGD